MKDKIPLLTAEQEIDLAKKIIQGGNAGVIAKLDLNQREENLLNKTYMSNSLVEKDGLLTSLSMVVIDGDKPSAEFLKKKIETGIFEGKILNSKEGAKLYLMNKYN